MVQSAGAGLQKLFELLDTPSTSPSGRARSTCPTPGDIEVDDVSFALRRRRPGAARRVAHDRAGRAAGARRPDRRRQVDAGQAGRPPLRPDRGRGRASAASTCATPRSPSLRERIVVVPQEGFLFGGTIRDNVRIGPGRAPPTPRSTTRSTPIGALRPLRGAARRARHRGARAGQPPVGGRAAARVAGPGRARRPGGARARRGDVEPRPRHRGAGRARGRAAAWRAARWSSSPTGSRPPSGPTGSASSTAAAWSSSAPTTSWWPGRRLRPPVRHLGGGLGKRRPRHAEFTRRPARRHLHAG